MVSASFLGLWPNVLAGAEESKHTPTHFLVLDNQDVSVPDCFCLGGFPVPPLKAVRDKR